MTGYDVRPIGPGEVDALQLVAADAFLEDLHDDELALWRRVLEPERALGGYAGDAIVAASGLLTMRLTVPGGIVPMAGLTAVGVSPVHRGRGLLDRMMRAHLHAIHDRGDEAVSALWASEAAIYGRWGFGLATRTAELTVVSAEARVLGEPEIRPRAGAPADLLAGMRAVYDAVLPSRPGLVERDDVAWEGATADFEHRREGAGRLRALLFEGAAGPAGYALYAVRKQDTDGRPDDVVELRELVAATPEAAAALWQHVLGLSLTRSVHWCRAPEDHELAHMLTDPRAVGTRLADGIFVRLVDVARALAERTYAGPVDVVFDVADPVCAWNQGRWRLTGDASGAACERAYTDADLVLTARELGAAFLGGTTLAVLGAAGRVQERTRGALAAASQAFKGAREPWAMEHF